MSRVSIAGVVLAGGMSLRMGGRDKALEMLAGAPLIGHVIGRIRRQVSDLAISVERPTPHLAAFGLPQLADPVPGHQGPLSGLLSGLRHFSDRYPWVLLAPCDAPFLPADLGSRLLARALEESLPGAVAVCRGEWQPTFSIWHRSLLPEVERAVEDSKLGGFKQLMHTVNVAGCSWRTGEGSSNPPPFLNVNDPVTLEEADRWLQHAAGGALPCSA